VSVPGLAARRAAAALVAGVLEGGRSLADQTGAAGPLGALTPAERARAQALAAGTLRHLGRIDAVLGRFLDRQPPGPALNALRLAVAEMHLDGVPAHAAVDGAVRLARAGSKGRQLPGLVNAVARRVADGGPALWEAEAEAALPAWLAGPVAAYGEDAARAIAAAHRRGAPVDLTLKRPDEVGDWAAALGADVLPTGSLRLPRRAQVSGLPGYAEGAWWVQDAAAAVPVRMFGDLAGRTALDICAAPGGKTLQLAAAGAAVTALDASEARLRRLRENLARTGLEAEVVAADALAWAPGRRFDAVLVDAPCSATGTIRRHPDLPYLRTGREIGALVALQASLMRRAWELVAPGGRLVYCVCSLLPAEGEALLARFLDEVPEARVLPPDAAALGVEPGWIDAAGGLRLRPDFWPERGGMDGFYAVCLAAGPSVSDSL
jgi:16S rRNA (cytosine967-C5)-methyltransferase